jgi:hypothetical protein
MATAWAYIISDASLTPRVAHASHAAVTAREAHLGAYVVTFPTDLPTSTTTCRLEAT